MEPSFKSAWINHKQLTIGVLVTAIFGALGAMVVFNALNRGETWYLIGEEAVYNYIALYLVGLIFAGAYFARDYYNIKALEVSFQETMIRFDRHYNSKDYYLNDLNDFRVSSVIYGWFGYRKLLFRFKDRRDHRKYTTYLILRKDAVAAFEKALVDARKHAQTDA